MRPLSTLWRLYATFLFNVCCKLLSPLVEQVCRWLRATYALVSQMEAMHEASAPLRKLDQVDTQLPTGVYQKTRLDCMEWDIAPTTQQRQCSLFYNAHFM